MHSRRSRGRGHFRQPQEQPKIPQSHPITMKEIIAIKHSCKFCAEIEMKSDISEPDIIFSNKLKQLWTMLKNSNPVISSIMNYFRQYQGNPYEQVLRLMYNCNDFYNSKPKSLPFFIIEQFRSFKREKQNELNDFLTPNLKLVAYKLMLKQNTSSLTKFVAEVFEMMASNEIFLDLVRCMIHKKQYKEACQTVTSFNLQEHFGSEDFLIQLLYQDKLFLLDDYLAFSPKVQEEFVVYIDKLLGKRSIERAVSEFASIHDLLDVKWEKIQAKSFKKLLVRLIKKFDLSSHLTPNLNKRRNTGASYFLVQRRYMEGGISDECFKEMVQEAIGEDEELQKELSHQLNGLKELAEALKWAHFYHIDRENWPHPLRVFADDRKFSHRGQEYEQPEYWEQPKPQVEYHKLGLEIDAICVVDSAATFQEFSDQGSKDIDIVGIDCEWKPSFGVNKSELALMQIATRRNVFILDVPALSSRAPHAWGNLDRMLFRNINILKLGFGFMSDSVVIEESISGSKFSTKEVGFSDLLSSWKVLGKYPNVVSPFAVADQSGGLKLSNLVQQCLGHPLDKSEQCSNWDNRPSRLLQKVYAALDAYCSIEVYDVIMRCCNTANCPFEEICFNLMSDCRAPKKKNKKTNKKDNKKTTVRIPQPECHMSEQMTPDKIKFVCDTMLQGLGKKLRRCGIDTAVLENHQQHMECVRLSKDEERYILTRGSAFNTLVGCVRPGYCYKVISEDVDVQLEEILNYYRIKVTKANVFSRCQFCNASCFVQVRQSTMQMMASQNKPPRYNAPPAGYMDEATGFSSDEEYYCDDEEPYTPEKKWDLVPAENIDVGLCQTRQGVKIQMAHIPEDILNNTDMFYICEQCGKVYWEGSHLERVLHGALRKVVQ